MRHGHRRIQTCRPGSGPVRQRRADALRHGLEFAYLRRERGLSQDDLAQRARLALETVQAIESGTRLPTKGEFAHFAAGLELTAGQLAEVPRPVVDHQASGIRAFN